MGFFVSKQFYIIEQEINQVIMEEPAVDYKINLILNLLCILPPSLDARALNIIYADKEETYAGRTGAEKNDCIQMRTVVIYRNDGF